MQTISLFEKAVNKLNTDINDKSSFSLANEQIDVSGMDILCSIIQQKNNLDKLFLRRCSLTDDHLKQLEATLGYMQSINILSLEGNRFTQSKLTRFLHKLKVCQHLQFLSLSDNSLNDEMAVSIGNLCARLPLFLALNLSYNNLTTTGFNIIFEHLIDSNISYLNLSSNTITTFPEKLGTFLRKNKNIKELHINSSQLSDEFICKLAYYSRFNDTLEVLALQGNSFSSLCSKDLISYLCNVSNLKLLNIDDNGINDFIIHENNQNKSIRCQTLAVGNNNPSSKGIANLISLCSDQIANLSLTGSGITDIEFNHVANYLAYNQQLEYLDLSHNKITDLAINELALILAKRPKLQSINLAGNYISSFGIKQLVKILNKRNSNEYWLDVSHNRIDASTRGLIAKTTSSTPQANIFIDQKPRVNFLLQDNIFTSMYLLDSGLNSTQHVVAKAIKRATSIYEIQANIRDNKKFSLGLGQTLVTEIIPLVWRIPLFNEDFCTQVNKELIYLKNRKIKLNKLQTIKSSDNISELSMPVFQLLIDILNDTLVPILIDFNQLKIRYFASMLHLDLTKEQQSSWHRESNFDLQIIIPLTDIEQNGYMTFEVGSKEPIAYPQMGCALVYPGKTGYRYKNSITKSSGYLLKINADIIPPSGHDMHSIKP